MGIKFHKGANRRDSTFFRKLPPEVRREIFVQVFGSSRVHVGFTSPEKGFIRKGHPLKSSKRMWHCVCRKPAGLEPHTHKERNHKWSYLATNVIFTCKWAYEEGIAVLYSTNTLMFQSARDFGVFQAYTHTSHSRFIRSLDFTIEAKRFFHPFGEAAANLSLIPQSLGRIYPFGRRAGSESRARIFLHYSPNHQPISPGDSAQVRDYLENLFNLTDFRTEVILPLETKLCLSQSRKLVDFILTPSDSHKVRFVEGGSREHFMNEPYDSEDSNDIDYGLRRL
ncbi:Fc.00g030230.m01.CDS01 [Cosmosporella sp. VM-42]